MEQIELAGVHSGDSACVIPTYMVAPQYVQTMRDYTVKLAQALKVVGLINVQYAIKDGTVYVLEANPRASRTVPFVAKAGGYPWAQIATMLAADGMHLADHTFDLANPRSLPYHVKEVVLPWHRFRGAAVQLGPEMRSTGEAMGSGMTFGEAFAKAQQGARTMLPTSGKAFISVNDNDKQNVIPIARDLAELGFTLLATRGTAAALQAAGLDVQTVYKVNEGRPNTIDYIKNRELALIVNTPLGKASFMDERAIRQTSIMHGVITITTLSSAAAAVQAIRFLQQGDWTVRSLQEQAPEWVLSHG
jgi:carbamoyl-phosphate synthase large subunit